MTTGSPIWSATCHQSVCELFIVSNLVVGDVVVLYLYVDSTREPRAQRVQVLLTGLLAVVDQALRGVPEEAAGGHRQPLRYARLRPVCASIA